MAKRKLVKPPPKEQVKDNKLKLTMPSWAAFDDTMTYMHAHYSCTSQYNIKSRLLSITFTNDDDVEPAREYLETHYGKAKKRSTITPDMYQYIWNSGMTPHDVCAMFDIPRQTYYNIMARKPS